MAKNRNAILPINKEVGNLFARAYRYLKAAASIYEDTAVINSWILDEGKLNLLGNELVGEIFGKTAWSEKTGKQRCLFASAITPDGCKNYLDTIINTSGVYVIGEIPGWHSDKMLERFRDAAVSRGFDVECYYCALFPDKLEHLVIPEMDLSFTSSNYYHHLKAGNYKEIDISAFINKDAANKFKAEISYNISGFDALMGKTVETISKAKALHDKMETYYVPNMDFDAVERCWEATMSRVLEYAEEV